MKKLLVLSYVFGIGVFFFTYAKDMSSLQKFYFFISLLVAGGLLFCIVVVLGQMFVRSYKMQGKNRRVKLMYDLFAPTGLGLLGNFALAQPASDEPESIPEKFDPEVASLDTARENGFGGGYIMPIESRNYR